jgi:hypothetical protein
MVPKYEFDAERWLRNVAEIQSHRAGAGAALLRENMLKCAEEIERLREFIRNGVEMGYIVVPDKGDPARDIIDKICGGEE